jgi:WD40 repeat protein
VRFWNGESGQQVREPLEFETIISALALHAPSSTLIVAPYDAPVQVIDAATGDVRRALPLDENERIDRIDISPDGSRILTANGKGLVRIWDARLGVQVGHDMQHQRALTAAQFSADGSKILTASWDQTARVWDSQTQQPVSPVVRHEAAITSAALSCDGCLLLTGGDDDAARLWQVTTGIQLGPAIRFPGVVLTTEFGEDGRQCLAAHGAAHLMDLPTIQGSPEDIRRWLTVQTGVGVGEDGAIQVLDGPLWRSLCAQTSVAEAVGLPTIAQPIGSISAARADDSVPFAQIHRSFRPRPRQPEQP